MKSVSTLFVLGIILTSNAQALDTSKLKPSFSHKVFPELIPDSKDLLELSEVGSKDFPIEGDQYVFDHFECQLEDGTRVPRDASVAEDDVMDFAIPMTVQFFKDQSRDALMIRELDLIFGLTRQFPILVDRDSGKFLNEDISAELKAELKSHPFSENIGFTFEREANGEWESRTVGIPYSLNLFKELYPTNGIEVSWREGETASVYIDDTTFEINGNSLAITSNRLNSCTTTRRDPTLQEPAASISRISRILKGVTVYKKIP